MHRASERPPCLFRIWFKSNDFRLNSVPLYHFLLDKIETARDATRCRCHPIKYIKEKGV